MVLEMQNVAMIATTVHHRNAGRSFVGSNERLTVLVDQLEIWPLQVLAPYQWLLLLLELLLLFELFSSHLLLLLGTYLAAMLYAMLHNVSRGLS